MANSYMPSTRGSAAAPRGRDAHSPPAPTTLTRGIRIKRERKAPKTHTPAPRLAKRATVIRPCDSLAPNDTLSLETRAVAWLRALCAPMRRVCGRFAPQAPQAASSASTALLTSTLSRSPQLNLIAPLSAPTSPSRHLPSSAPKRQAEGAPPATKTATTAQGTRMGGHLLHEEADAREADGLLVVPGAGHARVVAGGRHHRAEVGHDGFSS